MKHLESIAIEHGGAITNKNQHSVEYTVNSTEMRIRQVSKSFASIERKGKETWIRMNKVKLS